MPTRIPRPTVIAAAGNKPKIIEEFIGRVNSGDSEVSIARMRSPAGWIEPGQRPQFTEYTVVLAGMLQVTTETTILEISAGEAIITRPGEWIQYSTPKGAEYLAVCVPAFSPETVHRDE